MVNHAPKHCFWSLGSCLKKLPGRYQVSPSSENLVESYFIFILNYEQCNEKENEGSAERLGCLLQSEWRWLQAVPERDTWSSRDAAGAHRGTQHCHSCLHPQKQLVGQQPVSLCWEPPFALLADCHKLRKLPWACQAAQPSKNRPVLGYSETSECLDSSFSVTETGCHRDGGRKIVKISLRRIVRFYLIWANDVIWFVVLVVSNPKFLLFCQE